MKRLIISEEDRKSILSQHVNEGHTVSESMMGVAFGDEMNGLKIKKEEETESVDEEEDDDEIIEESMMVAFGDEMNGLKIKKEEPTEGVSDMVSGLKGVWRGEGYDYFKYLNKLKSSMSNLQRLDKPNHKIMNELTSLKGKISSSKMPTDKKNNLIRAIDGALAHFNSYVNLVQQISSIAGQKLS